MNHRSPVTRTLVAAIAVTMLASLAACSSSDPDDSSSEKATTTTAAPAADPGAATGAASAKDAKWEEVAAPPMCTCSDGTPYHYLVRRGDPEKVLFFLAGGGACFSAETCSGSNATYTRNLEGDVVPDDQGIFDESNPDNPLADYSMVFAPYCTGDLHLGTTEHDYGKGVVVQHVGYHNASTALGAAGALFPDATDVVVAGSSAGSAGAPMFGGAAHDVWPDADVSVVADSSAAYPGTPEITLAIGGLWGTTGSIPSWPETEDVPPEQWSLPGLFVQSAKHDPDIRFATFNAAYDEVQATFSSLIGVDPTNLVELIDANNKAIADQGVDIVNWVGAGTDHTILGKDELYDLHVGDDQLVDWLTAFLADKPVDDVHCEDCEKPTA